MAAERSITNAFLALDRQEWPRVWCALNRFEWPAKLAEYRPENWELITYLDRMKCAEAATLWALATDHTTLKERLREWNRERMTDAQFEDWWLHRPRLG